MPMQNEAKLLEYLQDISMKAMLLVANTDITTDAKAARVVRDIHNMLDQFGVTAQQVMPPDLLQAYFKGVDDPTKQLIARGVSVDPTLALTPEGLISKPFQKTIHIRAVEDLIDDTMLDMRAAIRTAKMSSNNAIMGTLEAVQADLAKGVITGDPSMATQKAVMNTFLQDGMTSFITRDGKRLPLRFYAMTVTRTKSRAATLEGSHNRFLDAGQDLVQVNGNGDSCEVCSRYHGMVISLNGATPGYPVVGGDIMLPPYHPNCRCSETVFIPDYVSAAELKAVQERNDSFDPEEDRRSPADRAAYEHEQALRRIANEEMKQWMRWQNGLGADAPRTLGAFRTMKRANSPKFQELQSNYLSWAHSKK